jgi:hypothetical protein
MKGTSFYKFLKFNPIIEIFKNECIRSIHIYFDIIININCNPIYFNKFFYETGLKKIG